MSTTELKVDLIHQIVNMDDKVRLKELLQVLKFQSDESVHVMSKNERLAIVEARTQIADGQVLSNNEFQKEIEEWLKK